MKHLIAFIREIWHSFYEPEPLLSINNPQQRIVRAVEILEREAQWDGPIPEGQGLPDGETWAHYCEAMAARNLINILTGVPGHTYTWTPFPEEAPCP